MDRNIPLAMPGAAPRAGERAAGGRQGRTGQRRPGARRHRHRHRVRGEARVVGALIGGDHQCLAGVQGELWRLQRVQRLGALHEREVHDDPGDPGARRRVVDHRHRDGHQLPGADPGRDDVDALDVGGGRGRRGGLGAWVGPLPTWDGVVEPLPQPPRSSAARAQRSKRRIRAWYGPAPSTPPGAAGGRIDTHVNQGMPPCHSPPSTTRCARRSETSSARELRPHADEWEAAEYFPDTRVLRAWASWACSGCATPRSTAARAATTGAPSSSPRRWPAAAPAAWAWRCPCRPRWPRRRSSSSAPRSRSSATWFRPSAARRWRHWASPSPTPAATSPSVRTRAVRHNGGWRINGSQALHHQRGALRLHRAGGSHRHAGGGRARDHTLPRRQ